VIVILSCHHLLEIDLNMKGLGTLLLCQFVDVWQTTESHLPMPLLDPVVDAVMIEFLSLCCNHFLCWCWCNYCFSLQSNILFHYSHSHQFCLSWAQCYNLWWCRYHVMDVNSILLVSVLGMFHLGSDKQLSSTISTHLHIVAHLLHKTVSPFSLGRYKQPTMRIICTGIMNASNWIQNA